jgi:hypothetical protein
MGGLHLLGQFQLPTVVGVKRSRFIDIPDLAAMDALDGLNGLRRTALLGANLDERTVLLAPLDEQLVFAQVVRTGFLNVNVLALLQRHQGGCSMPVIW